MLCQTCGTTLPNDTRFCLRCGHDVAGLPHATFCPRCSVMNDAGATRCRSCAYDFSRMFEPGAPVAACPNCPARVPLGANFCPGCGRRLRSDEEGGVPGRVVGGELARRFRRGDGPGRAAVHPTPRESEPAARDGFRWRLAATIIALGLMLVVGVQSCAASFGGALAGNSGRTSGGSGGFVIALLLLLGGACAIGRPLLAFVWFALAGWLALGIGETTAYRDMTVWAGVCLLLGAMAYRGGSRGRLRERAIGGLGVLVTAIIVLGIVGQAGRAPAGATPPMGAAAAPDAATDDDAFYPRMAPNTPTSAIGGLVANDPRRLAALRSQATWGDPQKLMSSPLAYLRENFYFWARFSDVRSAAGDRPMADFLAWPPHADPRMLPSSLVVRFTAPLPPMVTGQCYQVFGIAGATDPPPQPDPGWPRYAVLDAYAWDTPPAGTVNSRTCQPLS